MGLALGKTKGKAESKKIKSYEFKNGEQKVRLWGNVLARYVYWIKGQNNKDIPVECLAFNRDEEKFDNAQVDHVTEFYPELKCSWAYTMNCIDPSTGESMAINLKKKLFAEILDTIESLGDPTDPDLGWDIVFKKSKTGEAAFNVEYKLMPLKCKVRPLTEEERTAIAADKTIDEKYPRATPEDVLKLLTRLQSGGSDDESSDTDKVPEEAKDL